MIIIVIPWLIAQEAHCEKQAYINDPMRIKRNNRNDIIFGSNLQMKYTVARIILNT